MRSRHRGGGGAELFVQALDDDRLDALHRGVDLRKRRVDRAMPRRMLSGARKSGSTLAVWIMAWSMRQASACPSEMCDPRRAVAAASSC
ncbi:MAG: hypothetical protein R3A10_02270 [Caldilineaceae bacterium]